MEGHWQISQHFGDKVSLEKVCEEDVISAAEFSREGGHLCLGDKAGRLILFGEKETKRGQASFQYFTELQSHVQDFDPLKSQVVPEQINAIQWLSSEGRSLYLLSANDKIVKLWKISEKVIKKAVKPAGKDLSFPVLQPVEDIICPTLQNCFPNLHASKIKALSVSHNEEFLLSAEEERIFCWSLDCPSKAYIMVDLAKDTLQDIKEAVTVCRYHPQLDSVFLLGTNTGGLRIIDTRVRITTPDATNFTYPQGPKNFFSSLIANVNDARFSPDGQLVVARDVLATRVWDVRKPSQPTASVMVNDIVKSKLCQMYENETLWDQFSVGVSADSKNLLTGSYNSTFNLIESTGRSNFQLDLSFSTKTTGRELLGAKPAEAGFDFRYKTLKTCYHPSQDVLAVTCLNSLFFYNKLGAHPPSP